MSVEIRTNNIELSEALRGYVEHRLHRSLRRLGLRSRHLIVRLRDINGPRGGIDKSCAIDADFVRAGRVVLEERHWNLYTAIDLAAERFRRSLIRAHKRAKKRKRTRESVRRGDGLRLLRHSPFSSSPAMG
ncbi:MAG: ribosome-associated translation inhibitor RaiA [Acidobacteriota bacterium]|nr:ribosome-associated translation inhibitor RaiA [Acidobacteriota bacterium]